ncbi:MAG: hypothetical protein NT084_14515 [Bacteroidetes bacterium]|nr:hypothetical protein [Bacteroidota bacterium]
MMPNFPIARTLDEAIDLRNANQSLIGTSYAARESIIIELVDIIIVPHPIGRLGEMTDEMLENNRDFIEMNREKLPSNITWNVFAVCTRKSQENFCIPIESILSGSISNY